MADLFVSYSRRDTDFVRRLCDALTARGKDVWLDTETIADAEVFPEAIRRAIEECETFLFVITPASAESAYCEHEVEYARERGKRIVPVLLERVPDDALPEQIRDRNWIPFDDESEFDRSVERVVTAVDVDLDYRKRHTRWLVKAVEWERAQEDKSFLLRGSELSSAESWLAGAKSDADPPPTELQRSYLLRSRQANLRRQRRLAGAGLTVAAVAVALLIFALISRGQAMTAESTASSRALAAQSANLLGTDPETSLLLAMHALAVSPTPDAMYAVRDALDHSTVRLALPTIGAKVCYSTAEYNPRMPQILRTTGQGDVIAYSATSGHVQWRERLKGAPDCTLGLDPAQSLAAVGVGNSIHLLDPSTGSALGVLEPSALRAANSGATVAGKVGEVGQIAFSPTGAQMAIVTVSAQAGSTNQIELWNLSTKTGVLVQPAAPIVDASFTSDGSELLAGTDTGSMLRINTADGAIGPTMTVGGASDPIRVAASPTGSTVAVADSSFTGASTVTLWSTATWAQDASLASFGPINVVDLAVSGDGTKLAVGLADGAGGVWSLATRHELAPLLGQASENNSVSFSSNSQRVLLSSIDGSARAYQATGSAVASLQMTTPLPPISISWGTREVSTLLASATGTCVPGCFAQTWSWPDGGAQSPRLLSADPKAVVNGNGPNAVVATPEGAGYKWTVTIWTLRSPHVIRTFHGVPLGPVGLVSNAFVGMTGNGRYLELGLAGLNLKTASLRTYDVATGRVVAARKFPAPAAACGIDGAAATKGGGEYALVDFCGHVWLWSLDTRRPLLTVDTGGRESAAAFNNAGTQVAVASWDGIAQVFDAQTGRALFQLVGNPEGMTSISYSPDDRYIVSTSANGDVQTWSPSDGRLLRTQQDPNDPYLTAFNATGQVSTWDEDNTLEVWNLCSSCQNPSALSGMARRAVVFPLTAAEAEQSAQG
jgi:WD40 repeat protein